MTTTCPNCQTRLPDTASFCMNCGIALRGQLHASVILSFHNAVADGDLATVEQMLQEDTSLANIRDTTIHHAIDYRTEKMS